MFEIKLFEAQARLLILSDGFWDVAVARRFHAEIAETLTRAATVPRPLRIFSDLTGHDIQSSAVSAVNEDTAALFRHAAIDRYALVIPRALIRLQARRLLASVDFRIFDDRAAAAAWLDWPPAELEHEIGLCSRPVRPAPRPQPQVGSSAGLPPA